MGAYVSQTEEELQSHLYGIETLFRIEQNHLLPNSNRTFMELKQRFFPLFFLVLSTPIAPLWN